MRLLSRLCACLTLRSFFQVASHHRVLNKVGLFDIGHMVQIEYVNDFLPSPSESFFHPQIHSTRSGGFRGPASTVLLE